MSLSNQDVGRVARTNLSGFYRLTSGAFVLSQAATMALELPFAGLQSQIPNLTQQILQFCVELLITLVGFVLTAGFYSIHLRIARKDKEQPNSFYVFHYLKDHPDRYLISGFFMILLYAIALAPIGVGMYFIELSADFTCIALIVLLGLISMTLLLLVRMKLTFLFFILLDNSQITVLEAFRQSVALTSGRMFSLFKIYISFIGYDLLAVLSFGLGMFWVMPYKAQILSVLYLDITADNSYMYRKSI